MPRGWFSCCKQLTTEFRVNCPECGSTEHFRELPDKPEYETTGTTPELVFIRGFVYEHTQWNEQKEPVLHHSFWPTGVKTRGYIMPRKVLSHSSGPSRMILGEHATRWRYLLDGKTTADVRWSYTEPIPCPQPRAKETEYANGHWSKYTHSKGWEVIG